MHDSILKNKKKLAAIISLTSVAAVLLTVLVPAAAAVAMQTWVGAAVLYPTPTRAPFLN